MNIGDRIFFLKRGSYHELYEGVGMVIRVRGDGFDKVVTCLDYAATIYEIPMVDIVDLETGNEVFQVEISEFWSKKFSSYQYPAGLRLPVVAISYSRHRNLAELMVLQPDENKVGMICLPDNLLYCGEESRKEVLRRAMLLLPGYGSGSRGADQGKRRNTLWRTARTAVKKALDGNLKRLDERLGVIV